MKESILSVKTSNIVPTRTCSETCNSRLTFHGCGSGSRCSYKVLPEELKPLLVLASEISSRKVMPHEETMLGFLERLRGKADKLG